MEYTATDSALKRVLRSNVFLIFLLFSTIICIVAFANVQASAEALKSMLREILYQTGTGSLPSDFPSELITLCSAYVSLLITFALWLCFIGAAKNVNPLIVVGLSILAFIFFIQFLIHLCVIVIYVSNILWENWEYLAEYLHVDGGAEVICSFILSVWLAFLAYSTIVYFYYCILKLCIVSISRVFRNEILPVSGYVTKILGVIASIYLLMAIPAFFVDFWTGLNIFINALQLMFFVCLVARYKRLLVKFVEKGINVQKYRNSPSNIAEPDTHTYKFFTATRILCIVVAFVAAVVLWIVWAYTTGTAA